MIHCPGTSVLHPAEEDSMAKKAAKETSLPLVISLVFFVLTTITFGVMWYMQYSDQQAKDENVKKTTTEKTTEAGLKADAIRREQVLRIYLGIPKEGDVSAIAAETAGKDKVSNEVKQIREAVAAQFGGDVSKIPPEMDIWKIDDKGQYEELPTKGILAIAGEQGRARIAAEAEANKAAKRSEEAVAATKKLSDDFDKATKDFKNLAESLPKEFKTRLSEQIAKLEQRMKEFSDKQEQFRADITRVEEEKTKAERAKTLLEIQVADLQAEQLRSAERQVKERDAFQFDQPLGKISRRLPDNIVEIDIGSDAKVRPGLTFTVLPSDFPEKGKQSRMFKFRVPNERNEYKDVVRFVEKATIEVIDVLGPNLSRARITSEADYIRDGVSPGDLLYNSVWRKGQSDRIALVGVFDINGDGSDDIKHVVRDLERMGITVDAFYDLETRKWVGKLSEQTRFLVVGRYPVQSALDPNREEKTKLIDSISKAVESGRQKGIQDVNYRDFFPRMGYRVRIDVPDEKINQATAPYLKGVAVPDAPPPDKK